ncbi:MAG: multidrug ABC transporter ATP-binding protein [Thermoprotei archaeon]|nr:MAG: multidrug ABC transporter ATP-binding protein [Thermoprotei archaeon]
MPRKVLVVDSVHKTYKGGVYAVRGVSFTVYEGEIYGLIGPNGAGKTTTLRMIAGLIKPSKGSITVDGVDAVREPFRARKLVGYLPEEAEVYSRLKGIEHLKFYAELYGVNNVDEVVEYGASLSGLGSRLYERAGNYSKGMKRRLLLAIVLMRKPRLALLDEPTSGLDVYASVHVREVIKKYVRETRSSVVLSSHNMLEVEYLCDRIGFMYNGRIILEGSPKSIIDEYGVDNLEEAFTKAIEEFRSA